ncbi:hypothetical protein DFH28DRAFT_924720 [Melampsora americana]|nr:hypothetical protein DFH28DRAFT_924720 [Melampsora americana]
MTSTSRSTSVCHKVCDDCYTHNISGKIREGEARTIECMKTGGKQIVKENTNIKLIRFKGLDCVDIVYQIINLRMWHKKCADDSKTAISISAHTKEFAKCHSTIEKNGGCDHMTSKKCKYEFGRIFQGLWANSGMAWYSCN